MQSIDSAVQQFATTKHPEIILLGSSLIMSPVWSADFHKWGPAAVEDFYRHHHFKMLEQALTREGSPKTQVFSFAVPGAMVSDMFLIVDKLLKGEKAPTLVVYGVGPRDFVDGLASSETKTAVFSRLGDVSDLNRADFQGAEAHEKLEFFLDHNFFLCSKRGHYQAKTNAFCRKLISKTSDEGASVASSANASAFPLSMDPKVLKERSLEEYRMRYQGITDRQFATQKKFMNNTLDTCRRRGIKVLLVNMPLTSSNLALMPTGFYARYLNDLQTIAKEKQVALLDLSRKNLPDACFYDSVHLNAAGAESLLSCLKTAIDSTMDSRKEIVASTEEPLPL